MRGSPAWSAISCWPVGLGRYRSWKPGPNYGYWKTMTKRAACRLIAELLEGHQDEGEEWKCGGCGLWHEPQFTTCWKCGVEREFGAQRSASVSSRFFRCVATGSAVAESTAGRRALICSSEFWLTNPLASSAVCRRRVAGACRSRHFSEPTLVGYR